MIQKLICAGIMGSEKAQHLLPQILVDALQLHIVPQLAGEHQEQHTGKVAADDGQQVAVGTHLKPTRYST